jgi:hypothetical protein
VNTFTLCIQPDSSYWDGSYVYVVTAPTYEDACRLVAKSLLPVAKQGLRDDGDWDEFDIENLHPDGVFGDDGGDPIFRIEFVFTGDCVTAPLQHQRHHTGGWVDQRIILNAEGTMPLRTYYATLTRADGVSRHFAIQAATDNDAYKVTGSIRESRHAEDGQHWETSFFTTETPADLDDRWVHLRYTANAHHPYVRIDKES